MGTDAPESTLNSLFPLLTTRVQVSFPRFCSKKRVLYVLVRPFRFVEVLLQLQSFFSHFLLQVLRRIIRNLVKRQRIRVTLMLTRPLTDTRGMLIIFLSFG